MPAVKTAVSTIPAATPLRVLAEGHGPGDAWYGNHILAALAATGAADAYRRPAPGRHNVAEIALHHAYWVREARRRLTGNDPERFVLEGEDWFALDDGHVVPWGKVTETLEAQVKLFHEAVDAVATGRWSSPLDEKARLDLVVGIAAHAAYHAGQIQLVKALNS